MASGACSLITEASSVSSQYSHQCESETTFWRTLDAHCDSCDGSTVRQQIDGYFSCSSPLRWLRRAQNDVPTRSTLSNPNRSRGICGVRLRARKGRIHIDHNVAPIGIELIIHVLYRAVLWNCDYCNHSNLHNHRSEKVAKIHKTAT